MADPKACQGKPCGGVALFPTKPTVAVIPKQQISPAKLQGGGSGGILSHNGANIVDGNTLNIVGGNTSNLRRPSYGGLFTRRQTCIADVMQVFLVAYGSHDSVTLRSCATLERWT